MVFLDNASPLRAEQLEDFDALILLAHRFDATSVPKSGEPPASLRGSPRRWAARLESWPPPASG